MSIIGRLYINGQFVEPAGTQVQDILNPATRQRSSQTGQ